MARLNTISDGQPFTYQLLNQMIEVINAIPQIDDEENSPVEIRGPGGTSKNKPMILFGSDTVDIPENQTGAEGEAKFSSNFDNENPIVVATLVDPKAGGAIPIGYLTLTSVTNNRLKYRVKLIRKRPNTTTVLINYVAFGYTSD